MSAVLFFLLGAAIFSLGESKQTAVSFLVLALRGRRWGDLPALEGQ